MDAIFEWSVPSENENSLRSFLGHKIVDLIKTSYETYDQYQSYLDEVGISDYRDYLSFFKFSYGGLLIKFDNGINCSFGSAEDLNSVILCFENGSYLIPTDVEELACVSKMNPNPFLELLNLDIIRINILTRSNKNPKQHGLPSENGLEFVFANEKKLLLSHNLTDNNFVFGVLTKEDAITEEIVILKTIMES